ncbi:hypothetical protein, partial [Neisseria sp. P0013.S004]|uniref:hypothetical protein n=1 Tax=Neisseria sp. P0013.S004 TaxID=3436740 RepID=UPI003F7F09CC
WWCGGWWGLCFSVCWWCWVCVGDGCGVFVWPSSAAFGVVGGALVVVSCGVWFLCLCWFCGWVLFGVLLLWWVVFLCVVLLGIVFVGGGLFVLFGLSVEWVLFCFGVGLVLLVVVWLLCWVWVFLGFGVLGGLLFCWCGLGGGWCVGGWCGG